MEHAVRMVQTMLCLLTGELTINLVQAHSSVALLLLLTGTSRTMHCQSIQLDWFGIVACNCYNQMCLGLHGRTSREVGLRWSRELSTRPMLRQCVDDDDGDGTTHPSADHYQAFLMANQLRRPFGSAALLDWLGIVLVDFARFT